MATGPQLRSRPSLSLSPEGRERLEPKQRLEVLDEWTEEPARAQAESLRVKTPEHEAPTAKPPAHRGRGRPPKHIKPAGENDGKAPWAKPFEKILMQVVTFRIPYETYLQLRWLGGTTADTCMNDIIIQAVETEIARRLREKKRESLNGIED